MSFNKPLNINTIDLSDVVDDDAEEMIQLITPEDNDDLSQKDIPDELSLLPIKNTVLFPGVVIPITVGRQKSIRLVKKAYRGDRIIGVVAQKNPKAEEPESSDLFSIGTVAKIIKMLVLPDGNTTIIIQGKKRFKIDEVLQEDPYLTAKVSLIEDVWPAKKNREVKAIIQSLKEAAVKILKLNPEIPREAKVAIDNIESPAFLTHFLSSNLSVEVAEKQRILEINDGIKKSTVLLEYLLKEIQMLELRFEIHKKVHTDIDQQQRDYYLRQQIKVLQDELGYDGPDQEVAALRERSNKMEWPKEVKQHFEKELDKIYRMNPAAAEYPVAMNYVEFLLDLPWDKVTKDNFDLKRAKKVLDKDHYGLDKVKERIIEYLAVLKLKDNMKAPILCLYGPPGVGKTSLGRSVAKALKRNYIRASLGGIHDEAEIRGHRRTYVGAMPGKVIRSLKKSGASNPVFVLDEIDKINNTFRGDPSSALLEVLDPEQNSTFSDNYLELDYDLSRILFIATANSLDTIQPALRDRMEIIEISGYTLEEKIEIARKHLVPKQCKEHGLTSKDISFRKDAIAKIIQDYTRESGVRSLERKIGAVIRNIAKSIAMEETFDKVITKAQVTKILGAMVFDNEMYIKNSIPGVAVGLAWTSAGGEIMFIEANLSRGKGKLTLSGQLGDVMKESAMAALSWLRAHAEPLGIDHRIFSEYDLHVHVPAGAVPKDGPSAGITMVTVLASVFTQRKVRDKLAMTGEVTLRGKVLPVGGIKEKILAARRSGIKELILCDKNKRDIDEISIQYTKDLTIHYVNFVDEVLELALEPRKVRNSLKFVLDNEKAGK